MEKIEIDFEKIKTHKDRVITRKYEDMKDSYKGTLSKGNPTIYKVYEKDYEDFEEALTIINPGHVEKEFYMTKGHRHVKNSPEIYLLIKGSGKLLISTSGKEIFHELKKNKFYHIPGRSGHRLINTGKGELQVLTIYGKSAGHDYKFKFKKRLFKK